MNADNPPLCAGGCGFYGSESTKNLCSKCYKDYLKNHINHDGGEELTSCRITDDGLPRELLGSHVDSDYYNYNFVKPSSDNPSGNTKKKNRCGCCNKKVGLFGFECRCRGTFCSIHRYPEAHACKHDFKTAARELIEKNSSMDLNGSSYLLNHAAFPHVYYQGKDGENIIDLGLSLKVLQPEAYHPSPQDDFEDLLDWNQLHPQLRNPKTDHERLQNNLNTETYYDEEAEGIQSKQRRSYHVKVNMDGIFVGRKICILDHTGYSTLALQLEEMFGKQSVTGLRLFQAESEFSLLYMANEQWRVVGDVPWKDFTERVKRLRIVRKDMLLQH